VGIDLNALAAQLASQLATTPYPGRDAGATRDGGAAEEFTPPPRGVVFVEAEAA
jgi:hypothetical protein